MDRSRSWNAVRAGATAVAVAVLALAAVETPTARAAGLLVGTGEARIALAPGLVKGLRQEGVGVEPLGAAMLRGRKLTQRVRSGSYDPPEGEAELVLSGGLRLVRGGKAVALLRMRLDTKTKTLSAIVAGNRTRVARFGGAKLEREGFDARLEVKRLRLTGVAATALNRSLGLSRVFRAGASLGSVEGLAEPSQVDVAFGQIAIGGPETVFSRLEALNVQMGLWGATQRWGGGAENYFLFEVEPSRISTDASAGILEGAENDGVTMQIFEPPPREMLLRHPRIDLATGQLTATISPLSQEGPLTETIATLDYSAAKFQTRAKVGSIELMGIRAISNQFIADQLNTRFATPGMFQAGETLARMTVVLHS